MNTKIKIISAAFLVAIAFFVGPSIDRLINGTPQTAQNVEKAFEQIVVPIENVGPLAPLYKGSLIEQSFVTDLESINGISLYVATYFKSNLPGSGIFQLLDSSRAVLVTKEFQLSTLKDNTYLTFLFDPIVMQSEQKYFLTITSDVQSPESTFTLWSNKIYQGEGFLLKENSVDLKGAIIFTLAGK